MANEIKQLVAGKQESERKRKQAESQLQEVSIRLQEVERSKGDIGDRANKVTVSEHRSVDA